MALSQSYLESSNSILLIFDLTSPSSLSSTLKRGKSALQINPNANLIMLANKNDLERRVTVE
jgi:hypothetical protein